MPAAALIRLAMVRADMAKIRSSGSAPDALQADGGGGRKVGHVAARFLVGLGARDVQPAGAIGCFHGQVLPVKGCDELLPPRVRMQAGLERKARSVSVWFQGRPVAAAHAA